MDDHPSLGLQCALNLKEFLRNNIQIDPLRQQPAVGDLIAKGIVIHDFRPWTSPAGASVKYKGDPILESES